MKRSQWDCPKCKRSYPYDQPVIIDGCKDYQTAIHECGPGFVSLRLRPASKEAKAFWDTVKDAVQRIDW